MHSSLVVGAGISGLSAAVLLARTGASVQLWEAGEGSGGLLQPVHFQGVPCDRGSHRVHPESHPLLRELTTSAGWIRRPRQGLLLLGGKSIPYPPSPSAFLRGLGFQTALSMGLGFATRPKQRIAFRTWERDRSRLPLEDKGFEAFVVARVGRSAYRQFYKPYVEKVWGMSPTEISQTVAKQRISTSNPLNTLRRSLTSAAATDKTFLYPQDGLGVLIDNLRQSAVDLGVRIHSSRRFERHTTHSEFDTILYSGHLPSLIPEVGLSHRGLYILHLAFPKGYVRPNDTWYAPESKYWFGRVSQPSRFSPRLTTQTEDIICVEIPEGKWGPEQDFLAKMDKIIEQLVDARILSEATTTTAQRQTWIPNVYPIYRRGWFGKWQQAMQTLKTMGPIYPIGRQGLFLHCNMDHCVFIASEAVEYISAGRSSTEWIAHCPNFLDLRVRD